MASCTLGQVTAKLERLKKESHRAAEAIITINERKTKLEERIVERQASIDETTMHIEGRLARGNDTQSKDTKAPDPFEGLVEDTVLAELEEADQNDFMEGLEKARLQVEAMHNQLEDYVAGQREDILTRKGRMDTRRRTGEDGAAAEQPAKTGAPTAAGSCAAAKPKPGELDEAERLLREVVEKAKEAGRAAAAEIKRTHP